MADFEQTLNNVIDDNIFGLNFLNQDSESLKNQAVNDYINGRITKTQLDEK